jgi:hypothetical protein
MFGTGLPVVVVSRGVFRNCAHVPDLKILSVSVDLQDMRVNPKDVAVETDN